MTKLLQRVDVTLRTFYIFNSKFGKSDGEEHKKIVYYYPDDIEVNTKIKDVGLSEAIIAFTSNFTEESNDCKSLHTQKTTQVFYQPESDYWMVLVLNVPKEIRCKDGIEVAEYRGGEVHESMYRAILEQSYSMFRLFHGTFEMNFEKFAQECENANVIATDETPRLQLQKKLTTFYDKYIGSLKLPAWNLVDVTKSLQYLALPKHTFLIAHNFVNTVLATFSVISEAILLYKENVVCGGKISSFDLFCLHKFIVEEELLSKMPIAETAGGSVTTVLSRSDSTIAECYRNGSFVTNFIKIDAEEEANSPNMISLPKLYLGKGDKSIKPYYLVIYRALDVVMCLLISSEKPAPLQEFYDEIHMSVGPKLASISRDISESLDLSKPSTSGNMVNVSQAPDATAAPKYLFIDERSLKHNSNIKIDRKRPQLSLGNLTPSVLQLVVDLDDQDQHGSMTSCSSPFKESLLKTTNDFWIVKRCRNWRKYYVIIFNNKSTLLDVTDQAMRIYEQEQELTNDVFFDK